MDPLALVDIRAGTESVQQSYGSGYLLGPRLVLTARHVVFRKGRVLPRISVRIGSPGGAEKPLRRRARLCWPTVDASAGAQTAADSDTDQPESTGVGAVRNRRDVAGLESDRGFDGALDVALLSLTEPVPCAGEVRWGRPIGTRRPAYEGLGFPLLAEDENGRREVEQLGGTLPPLATGPLNTVVLDQTTAPRSRRHGVRAWAGASGTAVFCRDGAGRHLLVGVVVEDVGEFENRRLLAAPVWRFCTSLRFAELVEEHTGHPPVVEPVELAGSLDCRLTPLTARTPGSLLAGAAETVAFRGRLEELAALAAWRDGSDPAVSVVLVTGEGGAGKSRLAREFLRQSRASGWAVGLAEEARPVDDRPGRRVPDEKEQEKRARRLVDRLGDCTVPALVATDYAEAHPVFADTLISGLADASRQLPRRVLLLARSEGVWWRNLAEELGSAASLLPLGSLSTGTAARRATYISSVTWLARGLQELPEPVVGRRPPTGWRDLARRLAAAPPALDDTAGNALTLQMTALLDLMQTAAGTGRVPDSTPEQRLAEHERGYLHRSAAARGLLADNALADATATDRARRRRQGLRALDRSLAAAILLGPCDAETTRQIGALADQRHSEDVADWLASLYPAPADQPLALGQVQPDRLAEYLLGGILTETHGSRTTDATETGVIPEKRVHADLLPSIAPLVRTLDAAQTALFALARTAVHEPFRMVLDQEIRGLIADHPDPFAAAAPLLATVPDHRPALLDGLRDLAARDPTALSIQSWRANDSLPDGPVSLAFFSASVAGVLSGLFADLAERDGTYLTSLVKALSNEGVRLSEVGRLDEALAVSERALTHYRDIVDRGGMGVRPDLVSVVNNHAVRLAEAGRLREALEVSDEGVRLSRELNRDGDAYLPELAVALNNHAVRLAENDLQEQAIKASEEVLGHYRELVARSRSTYLPGLASALNNHALRFAENDDDEGALPLSEEALGHYRELVLRSRNTYLPDLAMALNNHAVRLVENARPEEARPLTHQAVVLARELSESIPGAHLHDLAQSLVVSGYASVETGDFRGAVAPLVEAKALLSRLPIPDRALDDMATGFLRAAFAAAPSGVSEEFRAVAGEEVPEWMRQSAEHD
ncbi:ATP-binding protein [Streptomyces griseus]|uniref:ATP-binding protein n=1 Tax=Streptomyces griseus TaxID=1911 RepID=UPI0036BAACDB